MKDACEWCSKIFDVSAWKLYNSAPVYCCNGCRDADGLFRYTMSEEGQAELCTKPAKEAPKAMRRKVKRA